MSDKKLKPQIIYNLKWTVITKCPDKRAELDDSIERIRQSSNELLKKLAVPRELLQDPFTI